MLQSSIVMWQTTPRLSGIKQPFYYAHGLCGSGIQWETYQGWTVCTMMPQIERLKTRVTCDYRQLYSGGDFPFMIDAGSQPENLPVTFLYGLCFFTTWWLGSKSKYHSHHTFWTLVKKSEIRFKQRGHRPYVLNRGVSKNLGLRF